MYHNILTTGQYRKSSCKVYILTGNLEQLSSSTNGHLIKRL